MHTGHLDHLRNCFDSSEAKCGLKICCGPYKYRARKENLARAIERESDGNSSAAYEFYQKAVDISPSIAHELIQVGKGNINGLLSRLVIVLHNLISSIDMVACGRS